MTTDEEYLKAEGIDPATGGEITAPESGQAPSSSEGSPEVPQAPTAEEMFSIYVGDKEHKFPISSEFAFKLNQKDSRVPYSNLRNSYGQSSHLQTKLEEMKKKLEGFNEYDKYKGFYDKYGNLQEWSEKNPEEFQTIWEMYQNRDKHLLEHQIRSAGGTPTTDQGGMNQFKPLVDQITSLKQELQELKGWKSEFDKTQQTEQEKADTEAVKGEIQEFSKKYPNIDLNEADQDGVKLWAKIINFGVENGHTTFRGAALDYLEDRLLESVASKARNESVKQIKTEKQQGIVAKSSVPFNKGEVREESAGSVRNKSYGQLGEEALAELRALMAQ